MSSDFYFKKWKKTLIGLEDTVKIDLYFQETKAHDKKLCEATQRLSGLLGRYMAIYNGIWECWHQNLQVQKTIYIHDILKAVVSRILELKHEIRKLEVSEYHFGINGLIIHKLTPDDARLDEVPDKTERPDSIRTLLEDTFQIVKEKKRQMEEAAREDLEETVIEKWWDIEEVEKSEKTSDTYEKNNEITEEQLEFNRMVKLIQAHERTRQVTIQVTQKLNKRQKWEKELLGTLAPQASYELKERGAKLMQKVFRAYFELKRQKQMQCKRDERLGIMPCLKPKLENTKKLEQVKENRANLKRKYDEEWQTERESLKQEYLKEKGDDIREHYRDYIRDWFKKWYEAILFFHDIPGEKQGGAVLIFKEELPTPDEWLEEYKVYLANKSANKNKTAMDKKFAKMEAKREEMERKREEHIKKKVEEDLKRKMMKNPTMHPGFYYPLSNKTEHIIETITKYHRDWDELDATETLAVKEKSVRDVNKNNAYKEAKIEIVATVEEDMRNELKLLRTALKIDYERNEEKMPETMKPKARKGKKKGKVKKTPSINIAEKLEDLVFRGYIIEYPKATMKDFIGDPNFSGDDLRCDYGHAVPYNGETRNIWWGKCRELVHGFHRILLVGPRSSGKTKLVHILATMNDAVLFEINPRSILGEHVTGAYLDHLIHSVVGCARIVQPAVIHIKHVHRLYYRKVPPEEADVDWKILQRYFVKKLFKSIHKTDKVTVVGSCVDPWLTKSQPLLKQFPTVVLMPNTSYGTVAQILKDWVMSHTVLPKDLNVSCLARELQGYPYGYIKSALENFMSAETIVKIAAFGLSPMEVYNYIIQDGSDGKVDYEKYLKWYSDKTNWGKKEQKHLEEQKQFKQAMADYLQRMDKKKKSEKISNRKAKIVEDSISNGNEA